VKTLDKPTTFRVYSREWYQNKHESQGEESANSGPPVDGVSSSLLLSFLGKLQSMQIVPIDFHHRTCVTFPCIQCVVYDAEQGNTSSHDHCPVHLCGILDFRGRWLEAEKDQQAQVATRNYVIDDTKHAFESPWPPRQTPIACFVFVDGRAECGEAATGGVEITTDASPQKQPDGKKVGDVEAF